MPPPLQWCFLCFLCFFLLLFLGLASSLFRLEPSEGLSWELWAAAGGGEAAPLLLLLPEAEEEDEAANALDLDLEPDLRLLGLALLASGVWRELLSSSSLSSSSLSESSLSSLSSLSESSSSLSAPVASEASPVSVILALPSSWSDDAALLLSLALCCAALASLYSAMSFSAASTYGFFLSSSKLFHRSLMA